MDNTLTAYQSNDTHAGFAAGIALLHSHNPNPQRFAAYESEWDDEQLTRELEKYDRVFTRLDDTEILVARDDAQINEWYAAQADEKMSRVERMLRSVEDRGLV